ncbi:hypothetical protein [Streptomyces incanus]|uniref:Uncharacterized protein n=1 Tax=Streptomyces incanus TaxID=887453 RepID=A0ABW0XU77_9ACTN
MTGSTSAFRTTPGAESRTASRTAADDAARPRTERAAGETVIVD